MSGCVAILALKGQKHSSNLRNHIVCHNPHCLISIRLLPFQGVFFVCYSLPKALPLGYEVIGLSGRYSFPKALPLGYEVIGLSGRCSFPKALPLGYEVVGLSGRSPSHIYFAVHQLRKQAVAGFGEEADLRLER